VSSVHDQQILHQIEDGLRADDRAFCRRLALTQSALRWPAPIGLLLMAAAAGEALVARAARAVIAARRRAAMAVTGRIRSAAMAFRLIATRAGSNLAVRTACPTRRLRRTGPQ